MSPSVRSLLPRSLAALALTGALGAPAAAEPRPGEAQSCPAGALRELGARGLTPAFAVDATGYRVPAVPGDVLEITARACDPAVAVYVNGVPVAAGAPHAIWVGSGRASVVLYRGWSEVGRYTISVDPSLPPAPNAPGVADIHIPGMSRGFDPAVARYRVPLLADAFLPVTVTTADPSLTVYVQGTRVESGRQHHAWAPRGGRVSVVSYRGWAETARYDFEVDEELPPLKLGAVPGRLYISGRDEIDVIDLATGDHTFIDVPGVASTGRMARSPDHARVYVTSAEQRILSAITLASQSVTSQRFFTEPARPGAMVVAADSETLRVADTNGSVMWTIEKSMESQGIVFLPDLSMPLELRFAPGGDDLWISGVGVAPAQMIVSRPDDAGVDAWWPIALPPSQSNDDADTGGGFDFLPLQGLVIVSNSRGDELVAIDVETLAPVARVSTPPMPSWVAADPTSTTTQGRVLVPSQQAGSMSSYVITTGATGGVTMTRVPLPEPNPCPSGEFPEKAIYGLLPTDLFLICTRSVARLDAETFQAIASWELEGIRHNDIVWAAQ